MAMGHYSEHPITVQNRNWRRNNSEHYREYRRKRYAAKRMDILSKRKPGTKAWATGKLTKLMRQAEQGEYAPPDITRDELLELYSTHNHACDLCGNEDSLMALDHDHTTGEVRGWLCFTCNTGLHLVDKVGIEAIARYLQ